MLGTLGIEADEVAHVQEHSVEVQLPFLQFRFKNFKILPVTIMAGRLPDLIALGNALTKLGGNISVVASSDFSHYVPLETAHEKDFAAIKKIEALDVEGFYSMVVQRRLSICGFAPITALMQYCKQQGYKGGRLLHYDTSATSSGDERQVVGYAAIKFEK